MERLLLHGLQVDTDLEGLPAPLAVALRAYFVGPVPASAPADCSITLSSTHTEGYPAGAPAFHHGIIRGFVEEGAILLGDGHSRLRIEEASCAISGEIHLGSINEPDRLIHVLIFFGLVIALRQRKFFHMHAGAVRAPRDCGALIVGDAGSGKTTATLAFANAGWSFACDDAVFLVERDEKVDALSVTRPFHLAAATAEMFPEVGPYLSELPGNDQSKWALSLDWFPATRRLMAVRAPALLLFPQVIKGPISKATPMPGDEAFERVLGSSALLLVDGMPEQHEHHAALSTLLNQATHVRLELGRDMKDNPSVLSAVLAPFVEAALEPSSSVNPADPDQE